MLQSCDASFAISGWGRGRASQLGVDPIGVEKLGRGWTRGAIFPALSRHHYWNLVRIKNEARWSVLRSSTRQFPTLGDPYKGWLLLAAVGSNIKYHTIFPKDSSDRHKELTNRGPKACQKTWYSNLGLPSDSASGKGCDDFTTPWTFLGVRRQATSTFK